MFPGDISIPWAHIDHIMRAEQSISIHLFLPRGDPLQSRPG